MMTNSRTVEKKYSIYLPFSLQSCVQSWLYNVNESCIWANENMIRVMYQLILLELGVLPVLLLTKN